MSEEREPRQDDAEEVESHRQPEETDVRIGHSEETDVRIGHSDDEEEVEAHKMRAAGPEEPQKRF